MANIKIPDIGDIAPSGVVAGCISDLIEMLGDQQMESNALNWIALCDHFAGQPLCSPNRRAAYMSLRHAIQIAALRAVAVDVPRETCTHLADSDQPGEELEDEPCEKCGRYYVDG